MTGLPDTNRILAILRANYARHFEGCDDQAICAKIEDFKQRCRAMKR